MASHNDITGDVLVSKVINKNFDKGFDGIDWSVKLEPEPIKPMVKLELEFDEERIDNIGQNGNEGLHYKENEDGRVEGA